MKVGDKLCCKISKNNIFNKIIHIEGYTYTITKMDEDFIYVTSELDRLYNYSLEPSDIYYYVYEIFITTKEVRNLKLKKLNEYTKKI